MSKYTVLVERLNGRGNPVTSYECIKAADAITELEAKCDMFREARDLYFKETKTLKAKVAELDTKLKDLKLTMGF